MPVRPNTSIAIVGRRAISSCGTTGRCGTARSTTTATPIVGATRRRWSVTAGCLPPDRESIECYIACESAHAREPAIGIGGPPAIVLGHICVRKDQEHLAIDAFDD